MAPPPSADWTSAAEVDFDEAALDRDPAEGAGFAPIPSAAGKIKNYDAWKKKFADAGATVEIK